MYLMSKAKNKSVKKTKANYKNTVLIVTGLILITTIVSAIIFFRQDSRGISLNLAVDGPVRIGEPFNVEAILDNQSSEDISEADVSIILPAGIMFADGNRAARQRVNIENIQAESFKRQAFSVVITEFTENKTFQVEIEYFSALLGRKVRDRAELIVEVEKWLDLDIKAPNSVRSGEEFTWELIYKNNADKAWDMNLIVQIPEEFKTKLPQTNIRMVAGERVSQSFTGSVIMEEGEKFIIKAEARGKIGEQEYILGVASTEILIAPSPLALIVTSTKEADAPLSLNEEITYTLSFSNNSDIPMEDVSLTATLQGEMFDITTITSQGEIDTRRETLSWNATNIPELKYLSPRDSREVSFSVRIRESYPIRRLNDKNFTVGVRAHISSPTVLPSTQALKTINTASITQKIAGQVKVSARALYRDAVNKVLNTGVFPPIAGQSTEYSIHWSITNYSTDMSDVEIYADLPFGVDFVRQVRIDAGEFSFDPTRRRVIWNVSKILATTGVLNRPIVAVFQIRATPSIEHIDYYMPLLESTYIAGMDNFTETKFTAVQTYLTTELQGDTTIRPREGIVRSP